MKKTNTYFYFLIYLFVYGCSAGAGGDQSSSVEPPPPSYVTIINKSQFPILEIRVHSNANYSEAKNILEKTLETEDTLKINHEGNSRSYLTVIRKKNPLTDELIAFTSAYPLTISSNIDYTLKIYDDIFRFSESNLTF